MSNAEKSGLSAETFVKRTRDRYVTLINTTRARLLNEIELITQQRSLAICTRRDEVRANKRNYEK